MRACSLPLPSCSKMSDRFGETRALLSSQLSPKFHQMKRSSVAPSRHRSRRLISLAPFVCFCVGLPFHWMRDIFYEFELASFFRCRIDRVVQMNFENYLTFRTVVDQNMGSNLQAYWPIEPRTWFTFMSKIYNKIHFHFWLSLKFPSNRPTPIQDWRGPGLLPVPVWMPDRSFVRCWRSRTLFHKWLMAFIISYPFSPCRLECCGSP